MNEIAQKVTVPERQCILFIHFITGLINASKNFSTVIVIDTIIWILDIYIYQKTIDKMILTSNLWKQILFYFFKDLRVQIIY